MENREERFNKLFYITSSPMATTFMCTSEDFTLGVWREAGQAGNNSVQYAQVLELSLEQCEDYSYSFHTACCQFSIPSGIESGDILGILHGPQSSLLHEIAGDPQLEVLFGVDEERVTPSRLLTADQGSRQSYPLLTFKEGNYTQLLLYTIQC